MEIILPVAGLGTRLRPQTWSKPKPLVSVAGKPMLQHAIDRVAPVHPSRIVFITGFLGAQIEAWANAHLEVPTAFVEQPEMRGQTDAIIRTRHLVDGDALILFPDMIFEADFSGLATVDADVVMFTKEVDDPSALGIAIVEEGRITKLVEKPKDPVSNLAVIGIYYIRNMADLYTAIDEQMARGISLKNEYFIADAIQLMIDAGKKVVAAPVTLWEDCGNTEALLATNRRLLDRQGGQTADRPGVSIIDPVVIDPSARLEHAVIGPHVSVGANAVVRNAVVSDAVLEEGACIESAVVAHSIVGRNGVVRGRASSVNVGDVGTVLL